MFKSLTMSLFLISLMAISTQAEETNGTSPSLLNEKERHLFENLVSDYIRDNPEIIIESLQLYQLRQEVDRLEKQNEAIESLNAVFADNDAFPIAGNSEGKLTMVEFFDYNCGACKMMFESIDRAIKNYPELRVVFVEFPIFGPQSDTNSKLALAAHAIAPDIYYTLHTKMMQHQGRLDEAGVITILKQLGLDADKIRTEAAKPKYQKMIEQFNQYAQKLTIQGTPAIVLGGRMINSALEYENLSTEIDIAFANLGVDASNAND